MLGCGIGSWGWHPYLEARQALSAFPLLQHEAHVGKELHAIPGFPGERVGSAHSSQHAGPCLGPSTPGAVGKEWVSLQLSAYWPLPGTLNSRGRKGHVTSTVWHS